MTDNRKEFMTTETNDKIIIKLALTLEQYEELLKECSPDAVKLLRSGTGVETTLGRLLASRKD